MCRRYAFAFAVVGYLIALWYYAAAFAPVTWTAGRALFWYGCVACVNITGLHSSRLLSAIVFIGPMNALVYAAAGYVLGMGPAGWRFECLRPSARPVTSNVAAMCRGCAQGSTGDTSRPDACHKSVIQFSENLRKIDEEKVKREGKWLAPACSNLLVLPQFSRFRQVLVNSGPRLRTRRSGVRISQAAHPGKQKIC